jgi:hypothetical protein
MRASPSNFLYFLKQVVTGANADPIEDSGTAQAADGGIWKDQINSLADVVNLGGSTTLTTAETGMSVLHTAATGQAIGHVSFIVPRDYDEASDRLLIRLLVQSSGGDLTTGITGTPYVKLLGTAAVAGTLVNATVPFSTTTQLLTATEQVFEIVYQGLGLKRDTVIDTTLAYSAALAGTANIYGIEYSFYSTIVSYNEDDQSDVPGGGANLPGFGNPLR